MSFMDREKRDLREKLYCPECGEWVKYRVVEREEAFEVRGEEVEILARVAVCTVCGEDLFEPSLENQNLLRVYRIYAERHGLVIPEEIRRIRKKYGVSQAVFARVLGVGKATIERYEAGALPTESMSNLIKSADSPPFFWKLLEKNKESLSESDYRRIREKIDNLAKSGFSCGLENLEQVFEAINTGNIDFSKLYGVVAEMLKTLGQPFVTKVKLMKLLWFVDRTHYERYGKSLTGLAYAHLPMGPAPNGHGMLLELLEESGTIVVQEETEDGETEIIKIFLKDESMAKYLDDKELEIVQEVVLTYGSQNTRDLIKLSHEDRSWQNTGDGELLPFP